MNWPGCGCDGTLASVVDRALRGNRVRMPTGTIPYVATTPVRLWKAIGQTAGVPFRGAGPLSVAGFAEALVGRGAPDEWLSVTRYRQLAAGYDLWTQTGQGYRHDTV